MSEYEYFPVNGYRFVAPDIDFAPDVIVFRSGDYAIAKDKNGDIIAISKDHASVIQAAINHTAEQGGGKVYIKKGTYTLSGDTYALKALSNVALVGEDAVLRGDGKVLRLIWIPSDVARFRIEGLILENAAERAVWISGGSDITIIDNEFRNNTGLAIYCADVVTRLRIEGNYIHDNGGGMDVRAKPGVIARNIITNNGGGAIVFRNSQYVVVEENYIDYNAGNGIDPSGSPDVIIRGNIVRRCGQDYTGTQEQRGITALGERTVVVGNLVEECGEYGIGVWNIGNIVIAGNIVRNNGKADRYKYGILIHASEGYTVTNVVVIGNRCYDDQDTKTQDYGIAWEGPGTITKILIAYNDIEGNGIAGTNFGAGQDWYIVNNWGFSTEIFKASVSPSIGVNDTYGSASNVYSPSGRITLIRGVKITWEGTFGTDETVTVLVRSHFSDGTSATVTKSASATGSVWLTDDELLTLHKNGVHIRRIETRAKTNLSSTDVTVTVNVFGAG